MSAVRERLQRRVLPRLVVGLSTVDRHRRWAAALRRRLGGRATVRLYVAFDDPASAVALLGVVELVEERRVRLVVEPVAERGIPDDPAVEAKRRYAVVDAARLARRLGLELSRAEPLAAADGARIAARAAAIPSGPERTAFCVDAMQQLWFGSGAEPAGGREDTAALRGHERAFRRRRLYDTPVAVVGGQWFFAHERLTQIEQRLDDLGWVKAP